MSGIVCDPDKVPAGTARLECVRCMQHYPIAEIEESLELTSAELAVIIPLETFRWRRGDLQQDRRAGHFGPERLRPDPALSGG